MNSKYPIMMFALLVGFVSCSRNEQTENERKLDPPVTAREIQEKYQDAATATKDYVIENKDEFVAAMDKKLNELDAKIGELAQKSPSYKDDAKARADQALTALREQRTAVNARFEEVKKATAQSWNEVKAGFDSAMAEFDKLYESAESKLSQP